MKKKETACEENCKCKIEGKTHSWNDGCGCPEHNGERCDSPIQEPEEWEKELLDEEKLLSVNRFIERSEKKITKGAA